MSISIMTNLDSEAATRFLHKTERATSKSLGRLSSGTRVGTAGDDSSGVAISEGLRAGIRGLAQAHRNTQDGVSMLQVAEGALNEVHGILGRMRELAVQSANGVMTDSTRLHIQAEFQSMKSELDQITNGTDFNGQKLLNTAVTLTFQTGAFAVTSENSVSITLTDSNTTSLGGTVIGTSLAGTSVSTFGQALEAISSIDQAINDVSTQRSSIGAVQNRLTFALDNISNARESLLSSRSRIADSDVANETSDLTRSQILGQAAVSVLAQASRMPTYGLQLIG